MQSGPCEDATRDPFIYFVPAFSILQLIILPSSKPLHFFLCFDFNYQARCGDRIPHFCQFVANLSILHFLLIIINPRSSSMIVLALAIWSPSNSFNERRFHLMVNSRTEASSEDSEPVLLSLLSWTDLCSVLCSATSLASSHGSLGYQSDIAEDFPSSDLYYRSPSRYLPFAVMGPDPMPRGLSPERISHSWTPIPTKRRLALPSFISNCGPEVGYH
ncbi:uncharacterized protein EV420DRAFT_309535 [Desarmillaria tabescens]|uniref:Uncharacterized protein n=1 Tax=Armillaria tabescens TaxID=1929756 RepID=A0AA39KG24_ARMTA|nr:uncharacterized protein EV420DRAFT_309535 [Desarmillaria tabescens]KAK0459221.1 hypothetical protein EV420DRAFT_309535 [Desarmillaria tabescens]